MDYKTKNMNYQFSSDDIGRIEDRFKLKNDDIIPTALDIPTENGIENQPIKSKEEYHNVLLKLLENILK